MRMPLFSPWVGFCFFFFCGGGGVVFVLSNPYQEPNQNDFSFDSLSLLGYIASYFSPSQAP